MRSAPSGLVPGYPLVSMLEAVLRMGLFKFFPDIVTTELIEQLGMPPYPLHIAQWLPTFFLLSPEEEEPETMVEIIKLDDPLEPIGFRHTVSEPEACAASLTAPILPSVPIQ